MKNFSSTQLIFVDISFPHKEWELFLYALKIPYVFLTKQEFINQFPEQKIANIPGVFFNEISTLTQLLKLKTSHNFTTFLKDLNQELYIQLSHDEIYDVINENGKRISMATWKEVHTQSLRHLTAGILIFKDNSHKEVLIQQRAFHNGQDPGLWNHSAGGHVLAGQTPQQTVYDELQEELFYKTTLPQFPINYIETIQIVNDIPGNNELFHLYEGIYSGPFYPDPCEVFAIKWIVWSELMDEIITKPHKYSNASKIIFTAYNKILQ